MFLPYIAPSLRTGLPHIYKGNNRHNSENKFWAVPFDWSVLRSMPQGYIFNVLFQGNPTWPCSIVHCTSPNSQKTNIWLFCYLSACTMCNVHAGRTNKAILGAADKTAALKHDSWSPSHIIHLILSWPNKLVIWWGQTRIWRILIKTAKEMALC